MGQTNPEGIARNHSLMIFTAAYDTDPSTGPIWAVAQTEVVQFTVLGVFLPVALIVGVINVGGPAELVNSLPADRFSLGGTWTIALFVSTFISFLFGEALIPPYAQRAFSAPDAAGSRKGFVIAGVFIFGFLFVASSMGLVALVLFPNIQPDASIPTIIQSQLPVGLVGLVLAALLAVIMSSSSSSLNSSAVVFVRDIYLPFINSDLSEARRLLLQRVVTVVVGIGSVIIAFSVTSIIDALLVGYTLWAPTIIVPALAAVMFGFRSKIAALSAIVAGALVASIWLWILGEPFGITALASGISTNLIVFIIAYNVFDRDSNGRGHSHGNSVERGLE